jgi:hypothetical protein
MARQILEGQLYQTARIAHHTYEISANRAEPLVVSWPESSVILGGTVDLSERHGATTTIRELKLVVLHHTAPNTINSVNRVLFVVDGETKFPYDPNWKLVLVANGVDVACTPVVVFDTDERRDESSSAAVPAA